MYTILVIEDEIKIAEKIMAYLQPYGYQVQRIHDFTAVLKEVDQVQPDLIILDVQLPVQDGYTLCRQIRQRSTVPILFLSARSSQIEQIFGIESGGDDYLTKPFQLEMLLAKVRAILRRVYGELAQLDPVSKITVDQLTLRLDHMSIHYRGEKQALTKNECKLLQLFMSRPGAVISRDECLEALWDDLQFVDDNTLTVNVTRVRKKLVKWGLAECIETIRGVGYRWRVEDRP